MMKLSTLWSLDRTIDPATGRNPVADRIAATWPHDPGTVRFFRTSANSIYTFERDGQRAYLRLAIESERSREAIEAELSALHRMRSLGVPVVTPRPTPDGDLIVNEQTDLGVLHAVLFDALPGEQRSLDDLSLPDMSRWGETVGRIHTGLASAPPALGGKETPWHIVVDPNRTLPPHLPDGVRREHHRLQEVMATLPQTDATYGLIHGDLELDNLTWTPTDVHALDFDGLTRGWYLLDIAKALADPLQEGDILGSPRIKAFVAGYRRAHPLDDANLAHLPDFHALSDLQGYLSLDRSVDMTPEEAEVPWLADLITRFQTGMRAYEHHLAENG